MDYIQTDVDGVPAFWIPGEGRMRAGLVFRVGRADETLVTGGITHLIEHLAMYPQGLGDGKRHNASVQPVVTSFVVDGDAERVTGFFKELCATLRNLPADRLEKEKQVIRAEEQTRGGPPLELLARRYGPATYGLPAFPEFGLAACSAAELGAWSAQWFTRGNAALWLAGGPPPPGLQLDLPDGDAMPAPVATSTLPSTPAYFNQRKVAGMGFSGLLRRGLAGAVYGEILERRLTKELRQAQGLTYTPMVAYDIRGPEVAELIALAQCLPESVHLLVSAFTRELERLEDHLVPDEELASVVTDMLEREITPEGARGRVVLCARDKVLGRPVTSVDAWRDRVGALTPDDIRGVGREVMASGLFMLPHLASLHRARVVAAPSMSGRAVSGVAAKHADYPLNRSRLIVGSDGVSLRFGVGPDGSPDRVVTVGFAGGQASADGSADRGSPGGFTHCLALLARPDGGRTLVGADGITVHVEPTLWRLGRDAVARIDAAVSPDLVVRLPHRDRAQVPVPRTTRGTRFAAAILLQPRVAWACGFVATAVVLTVLAVVAPSTAGLDAALLLAALIVTAPIVKIIRLKWMLRERDRQRLQMWWSGDL